MSNINYKELLEDCRGEIEVFGRPQIVNSKLLIESVKELQQRIAELEAQVKERDPRIVELTDRLVGIGPPLSASERHEVAGFLYEIPEAKEQDHE